LGSACLALVVVLVLVLGFSGNFEDELIWEWLDAVL
jgi:hypothetical protein